MFTLFQLWDEKNKRTHCVLSQSSVTCLSFPNKQHIMGITPHSQLTTFELALFWTNSVVAHNVWKLCVWDYFAKILRNSLVTSDQCLFLLQKWVCYMAALLTESPQAVDDRFARFIIFWPQISCRQFPCFLPSAKWGKTQPTIHQVENQYISHPYKVPRKVVKWFVQNYTSASGTKIVFVKGLRLQISFNQL